MYAGMIWQLWVRCASKGQHKSYVCQHGICLNNEIINLFLISFFFFLLQMYKSAIIVYSICSVVRGQLIYPDSIYLRNINIPTQTLPAANPIGNNASTNIQNKISQLEEHTQEIVSSGISKLAIAINNFYLTHGGVDNVVFSPVSIAGKKFLKITVLFYIYLTL